MHLSYETLVKLLFKRFYSGHRLLKNLLNTVTHWYRGTCPLSAWWMLCWAFQTVAQRVNIVKTVISETKSTAMLHYVASWVDPWWLVYLSQSYITYSRFKSRPCFFVERHPPQFCSTCCCTCMWTKLVCICQRLLDHSSSAPTSLTSLHLWRDGFEWIMLHIQRIFKNI